MGPKRVLFMDEVGSCKTFNISACCCFPVWVSLFAVICHVCCLPLLTAAHHHSHGRLLQHLSALQRP